MQFQESVKVCFAKYADFDGRAARSEFWWFALFIFIIGAVIYYFSPIVGGLFNLLTLLPRLAVGARRLHDTGRSGWWQLLVFLPVIGWIILLVWYILPGTTSAEAAPAA